MIMEQKILIEKTIEYFGSQTEMAKALGGKVRQGHVYQWLHELKKVMPSTAVAINEATSGHVKASDFYSYVKDIDTEDQVA